MRFKGCWAGAEVSAGRLVAEGWLKAVYGAVTGRCSDGYPEIAFANRPRMQADIGIWPQCFKFFMHTDVKA